MHLDPVGSEETSSADLQDFAKEEPSGREHDRTSAPREGLPKRFRMRHGRHYVDELLGDAPLRTVREIPISEIEPPPPDAIGAPDADGLIGLELLEESIRQFGIIEPLAVARRGAEYRVIAGMRRLRAARTVGLSTVPCLIHDVDDRRFADLRQAVIARDVPAVAAVTESVVPDTSRLRAAVLAELDRVESLRAKTVSAAADVLGRAALRLERSPVSCAAALEDALTAIGVEARLRGVTVTIERLPSDTPLALDAARCRLAFTALFQALLERTTGPGAVLNLRAQVTTVRPALIVESELKGEGPVGEDAVQRLFDPDWEGHPCGADGAVLLAAVAKIARAHGGRVQARADGAVTLVIPKLLDA